MTDRRRVNGPAGGSSAPVYASALSPTSRPVTEAPVRIRGPNEPRKVFLKTGLTPSASGSAYFELESVANKALQNSLIIHSSALKITCTVHGPRPLPRSAAFTPTLILSTHVKYAPFAAKQRRGYLRDAGERDLAVHLETALRGMIIGERWPKSGVEVVITVLEGEEDSHGPSAETNGGWGVMSILSGCITVASAALADAGIDCVDLVTGGVAALVRNSMAPGEKPPKKLMQNAQPSDLQLVVDPCPSEHKEVVAVCVVGYSKARDEITELWVKGAMPIPLNTGSGTHNYSEELVEKAIYAASSTRILLNEAITEATMSKIESKT